MYIVFSVNNITGHFIAHKDIRKMVALFFTSQEMFISLSISGDLKGGGCNDVFTIHTIQRNINSIFKVDMLPTYALQCWNK